MSFMAFLFFKQDCDQEVTYRNKSDSKTAISPEIHSRMGDHSQNTRNLKCMVQLSSKVVGLETLFSRDIGKSEPLLGSNDSLKLSLPPQSFLLK